MTARSQLAPVWILAGLIALGPACGGGDLTASAELGATPGGAQDNDLARDQIDRGQVPAPEDITVEGMLNDHDLPLEAPPCTRDFCIRAAYGIAPALDTGRASIFVQMGFASGIDPETFHRSPLNLAVVVDRSGSMDGTKIESVRQALSRLIDQLDERDRLAIVLFDDRVDLLLESTQVTDREAIRALLEAVWARGSTNMAAGLRAGFEQVAANAGTPGVADRVMVFTDAMTNTGDTDTATFIELANQHATDGIGLTVFGVGVDLNQELVLAISQLQGGNYFYLEDAHKIATVFDEDFDYLVTPLAYDLRFRLEPKPGFRIETVYGYPSWTAGSTAVEIRVATVFLSRNHGALVARLEAEGDSWPLGKPPLAELSLSYEPRDGGERVQDAFVAAYSNDEELHDQTVFYSQRSVRKTVALVNAALGMRRACALYWDGRVEEAREVLRATIALLESEADEIEDAEVRGEATEARALLDNMGATSYDDYPYEDYPYDNCDPTYDYCPCGTYGEYCGVDYVEEDEHRHPFACTYAAGSSASPLLLLALGVALAAVVSRRR